MRSKGPEPVVPADLVARAREALAEVDRARERLDAVLTGPAVSRSERRLAHAELRHAFTRADALLREAARVAKQHSRSEWMLWRSRMTRLSTARQLHLFAERDAGVRPIGSVRAVDTGMSGPGIGDLLHGASREPGAPATYGLDLEQVLSEAVAPPVRLGGSRRASTGPTAEPVVAWPPAPGSAGAIHRSRRPGRRPTRKRVPAPTGDPRVTV